MSVVITSVGDDAGARARCGAVTSPSGAQRTRHRSRSPATTAISAAWAGRTPDRLRRPAARYGCRADSFIEDDLGRRSPGHDRTSSSTAIGRIGFIGDDISRSPPQRRPAGRLPRQLSRMPDWIPRRRARCPWRGKPIAGAATAFAELDAVTGQAALFCAERPLGDKPGTAGPLQ